MDIIIDLSAITSFFYQSPDFVLRSVFLWFGGPVLVITLFIGFYQIWLNGRAGKWKASNKFILLAIDIPRSNLQTPKAVENMFSYLGGAHGSQNAIEKYIEGQFQLTFSYEIVSIDGFTQFLIHLPEKFKQLIETSVYSQYPDAEITEVDDYTNGMPTDFPDDTWDVFGAEFMYAKNEAFPIKTFPAFETKTGPTEMLYKDPSAALMDLCSSLTEGEQLWYQIIVKPVGFDEMDVSEKEIAKIMNEKTKADDHLGDMFVNFVIKVLQEFSEFIYALWGDLGDDVKEEEKALKMVDLKPIQKNQLEAISLKATQMSYKAKIRFVYIAKKEVMNKAKVVNGFVGYIKQFADVQLNNLKPDMKKTATSLSYAPKKGRLNARKRKIVKNYIGRSGSAGRSMQTMSIEELATLWNFPQSDYIKAAGLQKVPAKRSQAPSSLPVNSGSGGGNDQDMLETDLSQELEGGKQDGLDESVFEADKNINEPGIEELNQSDPKKAKDSAPDNLPFA